MEFPLQMSRAWSSGADLRGRIKSEPQDFVVVELMEEPFTGEGEHLCAQIRKTNQNTHWVAGQLAGIAGLRPHDVGFAGRKDRVAVTTQWFSLPVASISADQVAQIEGCELLQQTRHIRKLRPGDHAGNQFRIRIRELAGDAKLREQILNQVAAHGFPNYFGAQRFGRDGANLQQGWELLQRRKRLSGRQRGLYLSALRSWLFNQVLDRHLQRGNWQAVCDAAEDWTGPLWGRGRNRPTELEASVEAEVADACAELCNALEFSGLNQERRILRARPDNFSWQAETADQLVLSFDLAPGQFATELLAELISADHL